MAACGGAMAELPQPAGPEAFAPFDPRQAALGRLLFYDPILSGNRNISCGTCHHHDQFSADGVSLGIGEGGQGVGPERTAPDGPNRIAKRVPRHAPALWNLGAREFRIFFHDGRVSASPDYGNGMNTPAEEWLPEGLDSLLAAQAIFPLVAQFEMAGNPGENEVAGAVNDRIDYAWPILAKRVRGLPEYASLFQQAFDLETPQAVTIAHIANALAAFMNAEWRSTDSPFDRHLRGEGALSPAQARGMELFYGKAGCRTCHSGVFQTDHQFHALGLPPFGPGRTRVFDPIARDTGRMAESNDAADAYRFRTPSLRNVALTPPYGHNGAYPTLAGIIRHHLDPEQGLETWRPEQANLPQAPWLHEIDFVIRQDRLEMARQRRAIDIDPVLLTEAEIGDLVSFMEALSGAESRYGRLGRPEKVPSGLKVD
ncbi:MAG: methylamine utilization protein MauG [Litoreibacter sp.]|nr:methylamine utilization protein MauG [Litoreibacter sp.]